MALLKASSLSALCAPWYRTSSSRTQRGWTMASSSNCRSATGSAGSSAFFRHAARQSRMEKASRAKKDSRSREAVSRFFAKRSAASRAARKEGSVQSSFSSLFMVRG